MKKSQHNIQMLPALTMSHTAAQCITQGDNNPHTRVQSYCVAQLNHLLNRGKLTSITNNINSFSAPRGILLLGARGLDVSPSNNH